MAKFDIREFNYITCGKAQNTFNVAFCYTDDGMIKASSQKPLSFSALHTRTFFGDIGEYESMSQHYASNKASFYDIGNKVIIHNMYELPKTQLKTTADKRALSGYETTDKLDIYAPHISDDFLHAVQFKNYAYALTKMTDKRPVVISVNMHNKSNFDTTYNYVLSNGTIPVFTQPMPSEVLGGSYQTYAELIQNAHDLSDYAISNIFNIRRDLSGVFYNYLIEIPEDTIYNDYSRGYIQCDQIVTKNHLDYTYTLSTDNSFGLHKCRDYCNIGVCGGQLYLTYRDNVEYTRDTVKDGRVTYHDNKAEDEYDQPIDQYVLVKSQAEGTYTYQHVEVIDSWNRWDGSSGAGHKSSLFSLRLIDTGLNSSSINENAKTKLRQNIMNNIHSIIDKISPANTQLFNIYFEGK